MPPARPTEGGERKRQVCIDKEDIYGHQQPWQHHKNATRQGADLTNQKAVKW